MYWIDKLLIDFKIKSVYQLSKMTGIRESSFSSMQKRKSDYKNVKYGNMQLIASALDISMDQLDEWLLKTEEEINMKTELVSLSDVTIYLAEDGNTVYKKYHQNVRENKEIEYILSSDDVKLLKEYANRYNTTTDGDIADDAESYILEQLLV